jgi:hypothetical protein
MSFGDNEAAASVWGGYAVGLPLMAMHRRSISALPQSGHFIQMGHAKY